jgi:hypothetical protein
LTHDPEAARQLAEQLLQAELDDIKKQAEEEAAGE